MIKKKKKLNELKIAVGMLRSVGVEECGGCGVRRLQKVGLKKIGLQIVGVAACGGYGMWCSSNRQFELNCDFFSFSHQNS